MPSVATTTQPPRLTVVIPVRVTANRSDVEWRLGFQQEANIPANVEIMVVDDGSTRKASQDIEAYCAKAGYSYHRLDTESQVFSVGRARNFAAQVSKADYVMFLDVDLVPYAGFYDDVLTEIEVRGMDEDASDFLMFGVVYLSKSATEEFFKCPPRLRKSRFTQALLDNDTQRVVKFSTGTSVCVFSRHWYLSHGGNNEVFEGWGYEDIEFNNRMLRLARRFRLPDEFSKDIRTFKDITEYRGWKSVYRLFGDMTFHKGLVLFHAWHEIDSGGQYMGRKGRNQQLFDQCMEAFGRLRQEPVALGDASCGKSILFTNTIPFVYNRALLPFFGDVSVMDEKRVSAQELVDKLSSREYDRVVFFNPYGDAHRLGLYRAVRDAKLPFYVCERGALRDSVFVDPNGFNAESTSYSPSCWDHPIPDEKRAKLYSYLIEERDRDDSLEEQPARRGPQALAESLKVKGKKVLFVPLQRPTDTVIQYFSGAIGDYASFLKLVTDCAQSLPADWVVVAKRHPLEVEDPVLPGVVWANDANVKDLLELSSAVLLINSGVGVSALAYGKPLYVAGDAFYLHPGLARQAVKVSDVVQGLREQFSPDKEKVARFLSYLVNDFYCFGKQQTKRVPWKDGSFMTATTGIEMYQVRIPGLKGMNVKLRDRALVSDESVLFDRYRAYLSRSSSSAAPAAKATATPAKAATAPAASLVATPSVNPATTRQSAASGASDGVQKAATTPGNALTVNVATTPMPAVEAVGAPARGGLGRKAKKLLKTPNRFFGDSPNSLVRGIGRLLIRS